MCPSLGPYFDGMRDMRKMGEKFAVSARKLWKMIPTWRLRHRWENNIYGCVMIEWISQA
jgi:hypothetical protein